jgi:hypothetical protein
MPGHTSSPTENRLNQPKFSSEVRGPFFRQEVRIKCSVYRYITHFDDADEEDGESKPPHIWHSMRLTEN